MKYYLIVGEASGNLHVSYSMAALKEENPRAEFRLFGGDMVAAVGGATVKHYKELAYMGLILVLLHLRTILANMRRRRGDIVAWSSDAVVLVGHPGFNLDIAKFVYAEMKIPVYYYISPKIWAWKEYCIKNVRRNVDELFSIPPFEVEFFEGHQYLIHYAGNPTVDEVTTLKATNPETFADLISDNELADKSIIALLARNRKQEIKDNLPDMIWAVSAFLDYQLVLAVAFGISLECYAELVKGANPQVIFGRTYCLLQQTDAALVTSGTATLETTLFRVPQVICYHTLVGKLVPFFRKHILKMKFISLVNLIVGREVVRKLVADTMTVENMRSGLKRLLFQEDYRRKMLDGYEGMVRLLGPARAPRYAIREMVKLLKK